MTQTLINYEPPSIAHSPTSIAAAESIKPDVARLQAVVLDYIRRSGGCTDEELIENVNLGPNTPRARRVELVRKGLVKDSQTTRPTRSGRSAVVWVVNPK